MAASRLPFKVGQQAESKSFEKGFRGAWFRCKVNKLDRVKGSPRALLEFYDYPSEKMHWTQLYQKPPKNSIGSKDEWKPQLILRPSFPRLYHENQVPDRSTIPDAIVIVDDVWKVGDLVDWWYDGCYWSGRVTHLLGKDKVQVNLPDPPTGEGKSYEAFCNDLRPSLDWSLEHGWTVPESETRFCARLVQPLEKDNEDDYKILECSDGCASCDTGTSISSSTLASSLLSSPGCNDPHLNEVLRKTYAREDDEKEMVVQSTKMNLVSDDSTKDIANALCGVSSTSTLSLVPPSESMNPGVNKFSRESGRKITEEAEVQSINIDMASDDGRRIATNSLNKASNAQAGSLSPQTGYVITKCGSEGIDLMLEARSTDMIMDSDYIWRGACNMLDNASSMPSCKLLPSTECIHPEMNGGSTGRENAEQEKEVQSIGMNLDSDYSSRGTTSRSDKASSTLVASFLHSEISETPKPGSWREETEHERVQSTTMNFSSDDFGRETTGSIEASTQGYEMEENQNNTEVQSTNTNVYPDAVRSEIINRLDSVSNIFSPVGCIRPEINETSKQSSGKETEQGREDTSMNLDSDDVSKETIGRFGKPPTTAGALLLPSEHNNPESIDTSLKNLETEIIEKRLEVQSMNMILKSADERKQMTGFVDEPSGSHEAKGSLDVTKMSRGKDQRNFRQLPKRLRMAENHHSASLTEVHAIESSIIQLEEVANKIKWLKGLIIFGLHWSSAMKASWKFSET